MQKRDGEDAGPHIEDSADVKVCLCKRGLCIAGGIGVAADAAVIGMSRKMTDGGLMVVMISSYFLS